MLSEFYEFFSLTVLGWKGSFAIGVAITHGLTLRFQRRCLGYDLSVTVRTASIIFALSGVLEKAKWDPEKGQKKKKKTY